MLDAVRAEALKLHRHRATWMMVWIYPVVITLIVLGSLIYSAASPTEAADPARTGTDWIRNSTLLWESPRSAPGRFLIAGFAALVFAGEYGWNTWKLIIPARSRWQLIAAKWVVVAGFVIAALIVADSVLLVGQWIETFLGEPIPQGVTLAALIDAHVRAFAHTLMPIAYTIAFAGLFAVLTQSILATVILSIALVVIEGLLPLIAFFAYGYAPDLTVALVKGLPLYHMANLLAWAKGAVMVLPLSPADVISVSWGSSFAVVTGWIVAAGAGTLVRFGRQDLN